MHKAMIGTIITCLLAYGAVGYSQISGSTRAEKDPIYSASDASAVTAAKISDWDTAHGWGNHSGAGYLTTETDPAFTTLYSGGVLSLGADGTDGQLKLYSEQGATDYFAVIKPNAAMSQDVTYTLPADDGAASQYLQTDGSGALSWASAGRLDPLNVCVVSGSGGNYTSVADAITAINAGSCGSKAIGSLSATNRWTILIYPGVYSSNITLPSFVDLVGVNKSAEITGAITFSGNHIVSGLTIKNIFTGTYGTIAVENCNLEYSAGAIFPSTATTTNASNVTIARNVINSGNQGVVHSIGARGTWNVNDNNIVSMSYMFYLSGAVAGNTATINILNNAIEIFYNSIIWFDLGNGTQTITIMGNSAIAASPAYTFTGSWTSSAAGNVYEYNNRFPAGSTAYYNYPEYITNGSHATRNWYTYDTSNTAPITRVKGYAIQVESANAYTLPASNYVLVGGTNEIRTINRTGWSSGSIVTLRFTENNNVKHNGTLSGAYYPILLKGGVDFPIRQNETLTLALDTSLAAWREVSRSSDYGRKFGTQGTDVASANDITLTTGNYFDITGTTEVQRILGTGWTPGSIVTLQFDDSVTVKNATAAGSSYYGLALAGAADLSATAGDTLMLVFDGAWWREVSRSVN